MDSRAFPNDEIFNSLLSSAEKSPGIVINDPANGVSTSYSQLIRNIVDTRKSIQDALPASLFNERGILIDDSIWVGLQVPLSEEFIVGCLAILSLGGAIMPLAMGILPEEANHFLEQTNCVLLLVPPGQSSTASKIHQYRQQNRVSQRQLHTAPIICGNRDHCVDAPAHLRINESMTIPSTRPGLIVFTSGTTGPPKGAVLPRHCMYPPKMPPSADRRVMLCDRMAHWIGGVVGTLRPLLAGYAIELIKPGSPGEVYWDLFKQQRVTRVSWGPMVLFRLKQYFEDNIKDLPPDEIEPYLRGARAIREFSISAAMPTVTLMEFWEGLTDVPMEMGYGLTEVGGLVTTLPRIVPTKSSIGRPLPDVEMKLSEGSRGEVLIKGPRVMSHYLNDEEATKAAFDEEGFFRTGDQAHMEGDEFIFDGRASADFLQVSTYLIPALLVENALTGLPYVTESVAVAVPNSSFSTQLGALVRLRKGVGQISFRDLRADLAKSLPTYALPTKLRVLCQEETIPRTVTDKVNRKEVLAKYFVGVAAENVETCAPSAKEQNGPQKAAQINFGQSLAALLVHFWTGQAGGSGVDLYRADGSGGAARLAERPGSGVRVLPEAPCPLLNDICI
ncbi:hypothetical protein N7541_008553 [Penicillium brevicompactum]|uniref:AMP-dependent synthetase/ligase domain-containing protein n=1 Tax=Penicillium brevicompactum TaxID=5074 RepID=A0A9W9QZD1_PENBR|nr:hypothetical protein N7541_008553 [Penicillium brevicompactum]